MKFSSVAFLLLVGCINAIPVELSGSHELDTDIPDIPELPQDDLFDSGVTEYNASHFVPRADGNKFRLGQVHNDNWKKPEVPLALFKVYNKYKKPVPKRLQRVVDKKHGFLNLKAGALTGTASATPPAYYDSQYVVPVQIGYPAQNTFLNFDTGSSDLWVFSSDTYQPDQQGHILYKPGKSKTSKRLSGQTWAIRYGDGTGASGIVYRDVVRVGNTFVRYQAVQSAVEVSDGIAQDKFAHGIMGLAFTSLNTVRPTRQKTYFENIQNNLALPVFTANLQKGKPGNYNFGYINQAEYSGSIYFTPADRNSPWWQLTVQGFQVGKSKYTKYNYSAIVDTGTTLLLLPKTIVTAYYKQVKDAKLDSEMGVYIFPCTSALPDFYFGIGNYRGKVPGHYINYGKLTSTTCYGGIQSSDGIGFAILGDILLKAQFVVFNMQTRSVGFANKKTVEPAKSG
ncbi:hypothetical protein FZEAL_9024 [Fusarium zealandicum]|uniref:Peptidase A1 domain-containing protein n=1 Tax=Fusarium zealandicum TaxID=1053134 RepID=A0A8H4XH38_9HYPO|nr:hypothetical protein FZEAL_9024 [Fusarium zealandicum]